MRPLLLLLGVVLVVAGLFFAERRLRLGRDLIFHSDDVAEFSLPNGKVVHTNRWYERSDLLEEGQEFYSGAKGLGLMSTEPEGFAQVTKAGGGTGHLQVLKTHSTVVDGAAAVTPVGEEASTEGQVHEFWICRKDSMASR